MQVSRKKLRNCMLEGIDDDIRGAVWKLVSKIPLKRSYYNNNMYQKLLQIQCTEEDEICIGKDLCRTITGFAAFKIDPGSGKNRLYNLLKAYSNLDREVGYC